MGWWYRLNKLGSGGFAGGNVLSLSKGEAARKPPIFPHLLRRYGRWKITDGVRQIVRTSDEYD